MKIESVTAGADTTVHEYVTAGADTTVHEYVRGQMYCTAPESIKESRTLLSSTLLSSTLFSRRSMSIFVQREGEGKGK